MSTLVGGGSEPTIRCAQKAPLAGKFPRWPMFPPCACPIEWQETFIWLQFFTQGNHPTAFLTMEKTSGEPFISKKPSRFNRFNHASWFLRLWGRWLRPRCLIHGFVEIFPAVFTISDGRPGAQVDNVLHQAPHPTVHLIRREARDRNDSKGLEICRYSVGSGGGTHSC